MQSINETAALESVADLCARLAEFGTPPKPVTRTIVQADTAGSSVRDAALEFAAKGWPVFPIYGARDGGCACWRHAECKSPGKHPKTTHGVLDASTEPGVAAAMFQGQTANVGVRTGVACDVLDVDAGGLETLRALTGLEEIADIWSGPVARTRSGYHLYLLPTGAGNAVKMRDGLDYRGRNGYVVAPPSIHVSGVRYEWLREGALLEAPIWLRGMLP